MDRWRRMVRAQGGDPDAPLPVAAHVEEVRAGAAGGVDGSTPWRWATPGRLGAGRERKEDSVSATAGAICHAKPGEQVRKGQPVLELLADDAARFADALAALDGAATVSDQGPAAGLPGHRAGQPHVAE